MLWPKSLVMRTVLVLVAGLILTQFIGLSLYSYERRDSLAETASRHAAERIAAAHAALDATRPARRAAVARNFWGMGLRVTWDEESRAGDGHLSWAVQPMRRALTEALIGHEKTEVHIAQHDASSGADITAGVTMPHMGPSGMMGADMTAMPMMRPIMQAWDSGNVLAVSLSLSDGTWMNALMPFVPPVPFWSTPAFISILLVTILAGGISVWAVHRAARPLGTLADAADRLGQDVNASPLSENGPSEIARAARAFNMMQTKLRAFVDDRTRMLAAISHDLRTPITRLKLRAELIDDETQRQKTFADLDEMESMIASALAYARGVTDSEESTTFDIASLTQDLCEDERDREGKVSYEGPSRCCFTGQKLGIKRAITNLIGNAMAYGTAAEITLIVRRDNIIFVIEDDGPGIPADQMEQVFNPFFRIEGSRSRETGGTGLGLAIVRAITEAHGGDIKLENRAEGGLRAILRLPAGRS